MLRLRFLVSCQDCIDKIDAPAKIMKSVVLKLDSFSDPRSTENLPPEPALVLKFGSPLAAIHSGKGLPCGLVDWGMAGF